MRKQMQENITFMSTELIDDIKQKLVQLQDQERVYIESLEDRQNLDDEIDAAIQRSPNGELTKEEAEDFEKRKRRVKMLEDGFYSGRDEVRNMVIKRMYVVFLSGITTSMIIDDNRGGYVDSALEKIYDKYIDTRFIADPDERKRVEDEKARLEQESMKYTFINEVQRNARDVNDSMLKIVETFKKIKERRTKLLESEKNFDKEIDEATSRSGNLSREASKKFESKRHALKTERQAIDEMEKIIKSRNECNCTRYTRYRNRKYCR